MKRLNMSLKTKITIGVSLLVAGITATLGYISLSYFQQQLRENIAAQQFVLLSSIVSDIDEQFSDAQNELVEIAKSFPPESLTDAARAQGFLDRQADHKTTFDNTLILFSRDGTLIAETPYVPSHRGNNFSSRDYFIKTMASAKPTISEPFIFSDKNRHPVVMLTAPLLDPGGKVLGILAGSIDLTQHNFLTKHSRVIIGKSGYLYLFNKDRTMIMHPDEKRIMMKDVPVGSNLGYDKAIAGFEGTVDTVNSRGLPVLATFKRLSTTGWILAANNPQAEVYAVIDRARRELVPFLIVAIAFSLIIVWYCVKYLTAPLLLFTNHVRSATGKKRLEPILTCGTGDEIGILVEAFNNMAVELAVEHETLIESEESLRKVEQRLTHAMRLAQLFEWEYDVASGLFCFSDHYFTLHGTTSELEGGNLMSAGAFAGKFVHQDDAQMIGENIAKAIATNDPDYCSRFEIRVYRLDREIRHILVDYNITKDAAGRTIKISGANQDITYRKRSDEALKTAKAFNESTLDSITDIFYAFDLNGKFLSWNKTFNRISGYSDQQLSQKKPTDFFSGEDIQHVTEAIERTYKEGTSSVDAYFVANDGRQILCEFNGAILTDGNGNIIGFSGTGRDITERIKHEKELLAKNRELESFNYTVSHDLKSPLVTIQSYAGMISNDLAAGNHARSYGDLKRIEIAAEKMTALLDGLLELSRSGRIMGQSETVDMNCLIKDTLNQLAGYIKQSHAEVVVQPDLPAVFGDQKRLAEVVQNLIENAIKYMGEQVLPRIEVGTRNVGQTKVFFVSDNGMGIEPRFHEKIFDLFNKLDGKSEGTGVGLALVQRIVEVHGGRVWVESEGVDKGSTFCFTLPEAHKAEARQ